MIVHNSGLVGRSCLPPRSHTGNPSPAMHKTLILASRSPRRRELLEQIGLVFSVDAPDLDEAVRPGEEAEAYALRVAREKAAVAADRAGRGIVIAADTVVVLGSGILGKPVDAADAERMLGLLSGREHRVITGIAVRDAATGRTAARSAVTRVLFRKLTPEAVRAYAASGEPLDKAGAYGIQEKGALLVERIEGCFYNVVGLPLALLEEMLEEFGVGVWQTDRCK